ncbi:unnamed protein product [Dicrocoelium dendriticum]|nr:unnamed protein product [Dicrocoelium dendriticum]
MYRLWWLTSFVQVVLSPVVPDQPADNVQGFAPAPLEPHPFHGLQPIAATDECKQDVEFYCSRHTSSDWSTIECLQKDEKTLNEVSDRCQNLIWQRKHILTQKGSFEKDLHPKCLAEFNNISECRELNESAFYVPCLVEHKPQIKQKLCVSYLNRAAAFIFADYRLLYHFINSCGDDILRFECGRIDIGPSSPQTELEHLAVKSQGKTIHCLRARVEKLQKQCRMQIFRIAELQADDYHLDRPLYYACREDRERFCHSVEAGDGLVYACLKENKYNPHMSAGCRKRISERQQLVAFDAFVDYRLTKACASDIKSANCQPSGQQHPDLGASQIMLCLEAVEKPQFERIDTVSRLQPECRGELLKLRREMLDDYRLSPDLLLHCNSTIEQYCASKKHGRGAVLHCLLHTMRSYSINRPPIECERAIHSVLKATNVEENVILDPVIDRACRPMLTTKCAGLEDKGHGALFECLSANPSHPSMTNACRKHILELFYFVSRDVTLDDHLHRACADDSIRLCNLPRITWKNYERPDAHLLTCLYNHRRPSLDGRAPPTINMSNMISRSCQVEVLRVVHLRAASVSLDPRVFEVCLADLASCDDEDLEYDDSGEDDDEDDEEEEDYPEDSEFDFGKLRRLPSRRKGHARVQRKGSSGLACLQDHLDTLQPPCYAAVVEVSAEAQEDPSLDRLMAEACQPAQAKLCPDSNHPENVLQCLIHHKNHPNMDSACRAAVEHMQIVALKNIRISTHFHRSCQSDAQKYCASEISRGTSAVVVCLSAQLTAYRILGASNSDAEVPGSNPLTPPLSAACHEELVNQLYARSESIRLDPELAEACDSDRKQFCAHIAEGDARILECLHEHREQLSSFCHRKLFERDELMALENRADYPLYKACGQMINVYCAPVMQKLLDTDDLHHQIKQQHMVVECLTDAMHRVQSKGTFDQPCREHLVQILELRVKDYRLDPELQQACRSDIAHYCHKEAEATLRAPYEQTGPVFHCLRRHLSERLQEDQMLTPKCYARVRLVGSLGMKTTVVSRARYSSSNHFDMVPRAAAAFQLCSSGLRSTWAIVSDPNYSQIVSLTS